MRELKIDGCGSSGDPLEVFGKGSGYSYLDGNGWGNGDSYEIEFGGGGDTNGVGNGYGDGDAFGDGGGNPSDF